ncbi:hypothetical protein [Pseudomonas vancouverensis]|uniref:Uncharacterized protein n=1 Tax=Pseudomonas vancouverensis TaxID=95300 RepID=A0A1H2N9T9_PSEVA|nr:hypothetical protein [Pseudomonas vancouverensis]KAB0494034.1 hypothetical protein F7R09_19855 [Pseudomonas vancouverensis]TDB61471.1 hypothetical protein EIY72_15505 [Pseudomonas vancouverensis]SDV01855.1 hypothetical protein SAMN05216558_1883 [Pseudomonas vancouverensis]
MRGAWIIGLVLLGGSAQATDARKENSFVCKLPAIPGTVYFKNVIGKQYNFNQDGSAGGDRVRLLGTPGNGSVTFSGIPYNGKSVRVTILPDGSATTSLDAIDDPSAPGIYGDASKKLAHHWGKCTIKALPNPELMSAKWEKAHPPQAAKIKSVSASSTIRSSTPTTSKSEPSTNAQSKEHQKQFGRADGCLIDAGIQDTVNWQNHCNFLVYAVAVSYRAEGPIGSPEVHEVPPSGYMGAPAGNDSSYRSEVFACKAPYMPAMPVDERYFNKAPTNLPPCELRP